MQLTDSIRQTISLCFYEVRINDPPTETRLKDRSVCEATSDLICTLTTGPSPTDLPARRADQTAPAFPLCIQTNFIKDWEYSHRKYCRSHWSRTQKSLIIETERIRELGERFMFWNREHLFVHSAFREYIFHTTAYVQYENAFYGLTIRIGFFVIMSYFCVIARSLVFIDLVNRFYK